MQVKILNAETSPSGIRIDLGDYMKAPKNWVIQSDVKMLNYYILDELFPPELQYLSTKPL